MPSVKRKREDSEASSSTEAHQYQAPESVECQESINSNDIEEEVSSDDDSLNESSSSLDENEITENCPSPDPFSDDEARMDRLSSTAILNSVRNMTLDRLLALRIAAKVTNDLEIALRRFSVQPVLVVPYGSLVNGLACCTSKLDLFMSVNRESLTPDERKSILDEVRYVVHTSHFFQNDSFIWRARNRIITFRHRKCNIECQLSLTNEIGLRNTFLIQFFLVQNANVRPLVLFLKRMLLHYDLHGYQKITTYMLFWLVVFYMQQRGILPRVQLVRLLTDESYTVDGWDCRVPVINGQAFNDPCSLFDLAKAFFKFYSQFHFLEYVASPLLGCSLPIVDMENLCLPPNTFQPYLQKVLCLEDVTFDASTMNIQDPTELGKNLGGQVQLSASNRFLSCCYYLYSTFSDLYAVDEMLYQRSFAPLLAPLPVHYSTAPDDCIQCEIIKLTRKRLPSEHPARHLFAKNGFIYFARRLETILRSMYKQGSLEASVHQMPQIIRNRAGELLRRVAPKAIIKCSHRPGNELFVLINNSFDGCEVHVFFEGKASTLRFINVENIVRMLIQMP